MAWDMSHPCASSLLRSCLQQRSSLGCFIWLNAYKYISAPFTHASALVPVHLLPAGPGRAGKPTNQPHQLGPCPSCIALTCISCTSSPAALGICSEPDGSSQSDWRLVPLICATDSSKGNRPPGLLRELQCGTRLLRTAC